MLKYIKFIDPIGFGGMEVIRYAIYDTNAINDSEVEKFIMAHEVNHHIIIVNEFDFIHSYSSIFKMQEELEETKYRLDIAEDLLGQAHDLMSDTHCYMYEIYYDINIYFEGEYEHVGEGSSYHREEER